MPTASVTALFQNPKEISVLLPLPLGKALSYRGLGQAALAPGDFVLAPIGARRAVGVVWDAPPEPLPAAKLKSVVARLDVPPLPGALRRFVDWVSDYTLAPPGLVLKMCLSGAKDLKPEPLAQRWRKAANAPLTLTAARGRALAALGEGEALTIAELAKRAAVGPGVIKGLIALGGLQPVTPARPAAAEPDWRRPGFPLSPAQALAAADLIAKVKEAKFSATLLEGVTGSGKTETYLEALSACLGAGRRVLVLLPEIALTGQWLDRFVERFGADATIWHSGLSAAQRRRAWWTIATGQARVVVGARSALFLPLDDLGLIVVDEEHDASYKQEEGVIYHARDMALVRGKLAGCPVILVSATPSLETVVNCQRGRYARVHLPERHGQALMPEIAAVDLRANPPQPARFLSPPLLAALRETFARGEQALLFLNRRGYAPLTLCGACGHRLNCPNCSTWLVEHRQFSRLICHHCGYGADPPKACPACKAEGRWRACGPGVERLAEEAKAEFPDVRLAVLASDTQGGAEAIGKTLARIEAQEIDLVIGTQIVAKGHHFPMLTLVGVVDADLGLAGGDLRAAERTHQLLCQVAGRAGRAERPGRVLLQSFDPGHPVMRALIANDAAGFLAEEAKGRIAAAMPPFGRLAALILSGVDEREVLAAGRALARSAPNQPGVKVFGPAPAPLARVRGRFRYRLLLKTAREANLQALLRGWLAPDQLRGKVPASVRLNVDVDPQSFL